MLKTILSLGLPWLLSKLDGSKTYVLSILMGGAALALAAFGEVQWSTAILASLGAGTVAALRHGFSKATNLANTLTPVLRAMGFTDAQIKDMLANLQKPLG